MAKARQFPCETGAPSWNGEEYSLSITINTTESTDMNAMDEIFNKQRVDATLKITPPEGEDAKQKKLLDGGHAEIRWEIDIGAYHRSNETEVRFAVKIPAEKLNGFRLEDIGPRSGLFVVHGHKAIPEKKKVSAKAVKGQKKLDDGGMTEDEKSAYTEGCEAATEGKKVKDCPYEARTPERIAWAKGFDVKKRIASAWDRGLSETEGVVIGMNLNRH